MVNPLKRRELSKEVQRIEGWLGWSGKQGRRETELKVRPCQSQSALQIIGASQTD